MSAKNNKRAKKLTEAEQMLQALAASRDASMPEVKADHLARDNAVLVRKEGGGASLFFEGQKDAAAVLKSYTSHRPDNLDGEQNRPLEHPQGGRALYELKVTPYFLDHRTGPFAFADARVSAPVAEAQMFTEALRIFDKLNGRAAQPVTKPAPAVEMPPPVVAPMTNDEAWHNALKKIGEHGVLVYVAATDHAASGASLFFGNPGLRDEVCRNFIEAGLRSSMPKDQRYANHPRDERPLYELRINEPLADLISVSSLFSPESLAENGKPVLSESRSFAAIRAYRHLDTCIREPVREQGVIVLRGDPKGKDKENCTASLFFRDKKLRDQVAEKLHWTNPNKMNGCKGHPEQAGGGLYEIAVEHEYGVRLATHRKHPKERVLRYKQAKDEGEIRAQVSRKFDELSMTNKAKDFAENVPDTALTKLNTIIRSGERTASNETAAGRG